MQRLHDTPVVPLATLFGAISLVLFFEWHTDEPLVVLPVLIGAAFAAGCVAPRRWCPIGFVLGLAIVVAHLVTSHWQVMLPQYQNRPPSNGDYLTMLFLVIPSLAAAWTGSRASAQFRSMA